MLNVEDTIGLYLSYITQRDIGFRVVGLALGCFITLDLLRGQLTEINVLQLIPGLYFLSLLIIFILLVIIPAVIVKIPFDNDRKKERGSKSLLRFDKKMGVKTSFTFYTYGLFFILEVILPISVECFVFSTEKTLENLWSFQELNQLQGLLFFTLIFLFQVPLLLTIPNYSEQKIRFFNFNFRNYLFFLSIFAGFITPTVDVITQLTFTTVGILFYRFAQIFFRKQVLLKIQKIFFH